MSTRKYDSTIARMAGNIAAGWIGLGRTVEEGTLEDLARQSVALARLIVAEVERTETPAPQPSEAAVVIRELES